MYKFTRTHTINIYKNLLISHIVVIKMSDMLLAKHLAC